METFTETIRQTPATILEQQAQTALTTSPHRRYKIVWVMVAAVEVAITKTSNVIQTPTVEQTGSASHTVKAICYGKTTKDSSAKTLAQLPHSAEAQVVLSGYKIAQTVV